MYRSSLLTLSLALLLLRPIASWGQTPDPKQAEIEARIAELIEDLGSNEFATREKAQSRLKAMGLSAFEALLSATRHRDIEVATRVRFLLRGMPVTWSRDTDPAAVRGILKNYGATGRDERVNRMQLLANLEDSQGAEALCRIVRYEIDPGLSKRAALHLLGHKKPANDARRREVAESIRESIVASRRPAVEWLRAYSNTLVDAAPSLDEWDQIARREIETWTRTPEKTQRDVVRDLLRWHVDLLLELDRPADAEAGIGRVMDMLEGSLDELSDLVNWAATRKAWFVSEEVAKRFPSVYLQNAELLYRLAQARRTLGNEDGAAEAAAKALALNPRDIRAHYLLARELQQEIMAFDWAEQEFRAAITAAQGQTDNLFIIRREFSDLLFDMQREGEAAIQMQAIVASLQKDTSDVAEAIRIFQSYADYYQAMHHGRQGEYAKQRELLVQAYDRYPDNIDIVIAMHGMKEADDAWRSETMERLKATVGRIRGERTELEQQLQTKRGDPDQVRGDLAQKNNELAWLVSNTTGDFDEALRASQESLKLKPGQWEYLDTLARCYYAAGEYSQAVRTQKQAVEGAPHMQQMQRQLKLFEEALTNQKSG